MNLQSIVKDVISASEEVAEFIATEGANFDLSRIEQKSSFNNLVSYVDKEAERRLAEALHKSFPKAGFITEEGTVEQSKQHEYNWIVDPLDGTTNFLHGLPIYSISIGLMQGNKTILGVVHHVVRKECFHAVEDDNAYCKRQDDPRLHDTYIEREPAGYRLSILQLRKERRLPGYNRTFLEKTHGIRRLGSAAIDLAYVACGRMEGFFEYNLNPWDVAAGSLIVQQAGGKAGSDFSGGDNFIFGRELCAANGQMHAEMLTTIKQNGNRSIIALTPISPRSALTLYLRAHHWDSR